MTREFHWYELRTTDAKAAAVFYAKVVGWGTMDAGSADMPYTVLTTDRGGVAGIAQLTGEPSAAPGWIGYIAVDDVDAYADRLAKAGGEVRTPPQDIPGVLRLANVADGQGAPFVIYHGFAPEAPPRGAVGEPGYIGWHELVATEAGAAFDFYAALFGWTKTDAVNMGPMGLYQMFSAGAEDLGGMMTQPDKGQPPHWNYYVRVDSAGAAIDRLTAAGGTLTNGPHQVPSGNWVAQAADPQGAAFHLVSGNP